MHGNKKCDALRLKSGLEKKSKQNGVALIILFRLRKFDAGGSLLDWFALQKQKTNSAT
jgi:hypothetical protein